MTYREKIESMIKQINTLYNEAEELRNFATREEKIYWNQHRIIFYDAAKPLNHLNISLNNTRANEKL